MAVRRIIRSMIVEKLPKKTQLFVERMYFHYFVRNYIENEIRIIKKLCRADKNSLDIGANDGIFTLFLCKLSSHVFCFEPVPKWNQYLKEKYLHCNVTVEDCALGNSDGDAYLSIPYVGKKEYDTRSSLIRNFENEYIRGEKVTDIQKTKVKTRRLDDFDIGNIGFMKIDVEGFEVEVLKGAEQTIAREMPNIFIEIEQKNHKDRSISDIFNYIKEFGYYGYFVKDKGVVGIEEFDIEEMQKETGSINGDYRDYINNFIFSRDRIR
jgi:FkbM family methyltransferase